LKRLGPPVVQVLRESIETRAVARRESNPLLPGAFAFSPEGRTLYSSTGFGPHAKVIARDLKTGVERELRDLDDGVGTLAVSRDGSKLAIVTFPMLEVMDLSTGMTTLRVEAPRGGRFWGGDWSPDCRYLFAPVSFGNVRLRGELWRIALDGGATVRHTLSAAARGASVRPDGKELSMVRWEERQQVWIIENFLPSAKMFGQ
jgi:hypothetical protein